MYAIRSYYEGGPWGATAGLVEEFGPGRVRNTPISEAAICGIAIGAAQSGLRPVVEVILLIGISSYNFV